MVESCFDFDCVVSRNESNPFPVTVVVVGVVVVTVIVVEDSVRGRIPMTYRDPWWNRAEVKEVEVGVVIQSEVVAVRVLVEIMMPSSPWMKRRRMWMTRKVLSLSSALGSR